MGRASNRTVARREIRKAFGPEALELIATHSERLTALEQTKLPWLFTLIANEKADRLQLATTHKTAIEAAHDEARDALAQIRAHRDRGFFGRIWWLWTGR